MARKALLVTGMPGSGKEAVLEMATEAGLPVIRMGDAVRAEARQRGVPNSDDGIGAMAHAEREKHGPDVWARRTLERVEGNRVVVDGLRSLDELRAFREGFDEVSVVAVHASPTTRYERLAQRGREDDRLDREGFRARDERELGWGLGHVIALADHLIVNEGSPQDLRLAARRVLERVLG